MMGLWLVAIAISVAWWINSASSSTAGQLAVNSAVLAFDAVLMPIWLLFFGARISRPNLRLNHPLPRVAMVVTKAPSESWPLVRETIEAMLAQNYPGSYDVWLADEDPDEATIAWCRAHGVGVTTRRGHPEYQRDSWPRRARCKEGNLAYFYDTVGYERYDIVSQLDADHVPEPEYLRHMVAPFEEPSVGYVAAPSICDRNADRSWSARGRLYSEALLHGAIQAGCNSGWAPSCIGSHYAVRTRALKEIGGLGPELAEDFSTSLLMSSHGWEGGFAIDAEAHGDGPESVADCMTQDFQWSRSMMAIALTIGPRELRRAAWRARFRLGACLAWYPVYSLVMLASVLIPVLALATGTAFVRVPLGQFYIHLLIPVGVLVVAAFWLRHKGVLRPRDAKVISWEAILFQLIRWPWALIGCAHAVVGRIAGREFAFKVTPKASDGVRPLPLRVIAPSLFISVLSGLAVLLFGDPGDAVGYYFLALTNALLYTAVATAVVLLHFREQPRARTARRAMALAISPKAMAVLATMMVSVAAIATNGSTALSAITIKSSGDETVVVPDPYPLEHDRRARVAIGVTTDAGARNVGVPWQPEQLRQVNRFERAVKIHAGVTMWFSDWAHGVVDPVQLRAVAARQSVPEITWEPWNYARGRDRFQPRYSLASIAAGRHDAYILRWARALRSYGRPVLLRFAQEMNVPGTGYPWAMKRKNAPGDYVAAWRHIHDLFARSGATNVRWVWSPLASRIRRGLYPGNRYVDVVGLSGFNGGSELPWNGWRSFKKIFGRSLKRVHKLAPGKPVQISEVSTARGRRSKAKWVTNMFRTIGKNPQIRSIVWFDSDKEADWRIRSSPRAARAFARVVRNPRYGGLPYGAHRHRHRHHRHR